MRSELSSISPFDCSFLPRPFLLPPLLSRPIARPRNSRDRWSGNRSFSSKILLSHLSIIVSHCVHAITIKYIFLLFSIYSSISNPRSETIYCHLIGKIRSFKETIGSSRIYIYIYPMKKVKKGDQSRLSSFQRSKDSGRRRCRFFTDLNVLNFIHMYIYIYHPIYLVFSIFSSPLSRMMKKENGGSSHSVWNNEKFSKSKSKRGKKRVERTIDNRHEARTSGNNGKFDERIDACIVCRSIAIVCRKRYLSFSLSLEGTRSFSSSVST